MVITLLLTVGLDILHDGGCTIEEVNNRISTREELCDLARNYYENNPVCGEDNITYPNPYVLLCYKPRKLPSLFNTSYR